MLTHHLDDVPR